MAQNQYADFVLQQVADATERGCCTAGDDVLVSLQLQAASSKITSEVRRRLSSQRRPRSQQHGFGGGSADGGEHDVGSRPLCEF